MLARGEVLGRYEVLCPLGSGGMATVYAARVRGEASFEKLVALKLMLPHLAGDEKFVRMFVDEARVAGQVQSPHVVATLDLGRVPERGLLYQVLELVLGASLRQLLDAQAARAERPLPLDVALAILVQAARGLADAHAARSLTGSPLGLVHRDVSPHNVLVGVDGRARLSDFGVARAAARVSQTESGELKGKLAYASPEQLRGEVADARSDVFALGIVAWETIAGRRLFEADNPLAIVDRMMRQPIPDLREVRPEVSEEIAQVIADALVRDAAARLASAAVFADRLERAARGALAPHSRVAEVVRELEGARVAQLERTIAEHVAAGPETSAEVHEAPGRRVGPGRARTRVAGLGRAGIWIAGIVAVASIAIGAVAWASLDPGSGPGARPEAGSGAGLATTGVAATGAATTGAATTGAAATEAATTEAATTEAATTEAERPDGRAATEPSAGARAELDAVPAEPARAEPGVEPVRAEPEVAGDHVRGATPTGARRRREARGGALGELAAEELAAEELAAEELAAEQVAAESAAAVAAPPPASEPARRPALLGLDAFDREETPAAE